jgi:predicted secreted protein
MRQAGVHRAIVPCLALAASMALAQTPLSPPFEGTAVVMTGTAQLQVDNDEALASFYLELQDADLARAQSQVNRKVGQGTAALKEADPKGQIETGGYASYPVYEPRAQRKIIGWRVRQSVTLRTVDLAALPKAVAAAQETLALGGIDFRVSQAARAQIDAELIRLALASLNARVAAVAQTLNVPQSRVRIEELNFAAAAAPPVRPLVMARAPGAEAVEAPQFEAGQSTEQMTVSARIRLLLP